MMEASSLRPGHVSRAIVSFASYKKDDMTNAASAYTLIPAHFVCVPFCVCVRVSIDPGLRRSFVFCLHLSRNLSCRVTSVLVLACEHNASLLSFKCAVSKCSDSTMASCAAVASSGYSVLVWANFSRFAVRVSTTRPCMRFTVDRLMRRRRKRARKNSGTSIMFAVAP